MILTLFCLLIKTEILLFANVIPMLSNLYTKARLALGERIVAVLKQKNNAPKEVAQQVCIIYAVTKGYLNNIPVAQIPEFEKRLEEHMDNRHLQVLEAIRTTGELSKETEQKLAAALEAYTKDFLKAK